MKPKLVKATLALVGAAALATPVVITADYIEHLQKQEAKLKTQIRRDSVIIYEIDQERDSLTQTDRKLTDENRKLIEENNSLKN